MGSGEPIGKKFAKNLKHIQKKEHEAKLRKLRQESEFEEKIANVDSYFEENAKKKVDIDDNNLDELYSNEEKPISTDINKEIEQDNLDIKIDKEIKPDPIVKPAETNNSNKKYLYLGSALAVVFAGIFYLMKEPSKEIKQQKNPVIVKNPNKEISIDEKYKQLIQKEKDIVPEPKDEKVDLDINKVVKKTEPIKPVKEKVEVKIEEKPKKEVKKDIFGLKNVNLEEETTNVLAKKDLETKEPKKVQKVVAKPKKEPKQIKKQVKKQVKPKVVKKEKYKNPSPVRKMSFKKTEVIDFSKGITTVKPNGYFIQIGSFSKGPNKSFIRNIIKSGFDFTLYRVKIRNKTYTKVLIGPFVTKKKAKANLNLVKDKLKTSGAFIIRF